MDLKVRKELSEIFPYLGTHLAILAPGRGHKRGGWTFGQAAEVSLAGSCAGVGSAYSVRNGN